MLLPMQEGGHPTVLRTQESRRHLAAQQASQACLDCPSLVSMAITTGVAISSLFCAHLPCHCTHILCISCRHQAPQPLMCMHAVHGRSALKGRLHMRLPAMHDHLTSFAHVDSVVLAASVLLQ